MGVTPCLYPAHNGEALPGRLVARTRPWPAGNAVGSPLPSNGYGPVTTDPRKGTAPGAVTAPLYSGRLWQIYGWGNTRALDEATLICRHTSRVMWTVRDVSPCRSLHDQRYWSDGRCDPASRLARTVTALRSWWRYTSTSGAAVFGLTEATGRSSGR